MATYTREQFINLMTDMVNMYGVSSAFNNIPEGATIDAIGDEDLFFTCPECSEPIFYCDWKEDFFGAADLIDGDTFMCPICEETYDF